MAKLTLTTFVSLDGVMQGPGGPDEDTTGGFEYGGWTVPFADEGMGAFVSEVFDRSGAYLLGRRTYDIFSSYWPLVTDPQDPIAARLNTLPKHVVSRTLTDPEWENTTVVAGDVPAEVARLKERTAEGELQIHGSGTLAQSLGARPDRRGQPDRPPRLPGRGQAPLRGRRAADGLRADRCPDHRERHRDPHLPACGACAVRDFRAPGMTGAVRP